jgi:hypothetical protein|tara:strand:- start:60 stop:590 length:531 start_codon:yes stop_codon:yes gene_type:complete
MAGQRLTDKTALEEQAGSGDLLMLVDVNDTTGSAAGTSKKTDFKYVIQTDKYSLNNTEVKALHTTSKTLIGALSGYMTTVLNVTVLTTYAAATETSSNNLNFGYVDTNDNLYWRQIRDAMNLKVTDITYQLGASPASSGTCSETILNKPFMMWSNAAFNGGWSCDVYVTYAYTKVL